MAAPFLVILNPASSGGKAARLLRVIEDRLTGEDVAFDIEVTRGPGHAADLARKAVHAAREVVVAVGGDGTVHEVAQGLLDPPGRSRTCGEKDEPRGSELGGTAPGGRPPDLAVVPVGTGNDFFRMVGASRDPQEALDVALRGRRTQFDVGLARWEGGQRYFVNLLGLGVDVEVLRRREAFTRLPGLAQYLAALLAAVLRFEPFPVRIRLEGLDEIQNRIHLAAVTVGPSAGGGFLLNPGATPDDGLLDLCVVEALSYPEIARYIPRVIRGTHADLDVVELRRFQAGRIDHPDGDSFWFQLDGELMEDPVTWIEVEVVPGCLPVLVPSVGAGDSNPGERPSKGGVEETSPGASSSAGRRRGRP